MRGNLKDLKNIITLKVVNNKKIAADAKRKTDELLRMDLLRNTAKLSNKMEMRGYAYGTKREFLVSLGTRNIPKILFQILSFQAFYRHRFRV